MIFGIIISFLVLGVLIIVHELGHFIFARRVNILCREFAFGMGPALWKKKKGETTYLIKAFPIGGYCAIAGEETEESPLKDKTKIGLEFQNNLVTKIYTDIESFPQLTVYKLISYDLYDEEQTGNLYIRVEGEDGAIDYPVDPKAFFVTAKQEWQIAPYNRTVGAKKKRDRALVMFGGPMMNFILALVVFFLAGLIGGFDNYASAKLNSITENTPSYIAGLRDGDIITKMESGSLSLDINAWTDISKFMDDYTISYPSDVINIEYKRDDLIYTAQVHPQIIINTISLVSDYLVNEVKIGELDQNSKAYKAGLRTGNVITKVNGNPVTNWRDVYLAFMDNKEGSEVVINIDTSSEDFIVKPYSQQVMDTQKTLKGDEIPLVKIILAISPTTKFDFIQSIAYAGKMTYSSMGVISNTLKQLFTSKEIGIKDMGGFVAIISMTTNVASHGLVSILNWTGLLSVNLGLINLLPIPALDGGRLVFLAYEAITKKKPNQKVETALITMTMLLLFGLMIFITFNDIMRLIGGK